MFSLDLKQPYSLSDLQSLLRGLNIANTLTSDEQFEINAISDGRRPVASSFCFLDDLAGIITQKKVLYITSISLENACCLLVEDPRYVFIKLLAYLQKKDHVYSLSPSHRNVGIHSAAIIHNSAILEEDVVIGNGTIISAGCVIKRGTVIAENCIIRENTVIGCEGIALYKSKNGEVLRFPHLSGVEIGSNVEIGANAVIVRGTLKPTKIEDNVVIGNLCNIGHGVVVKAKVWMSVGTLIGGNCNIANNVTIGLGVNVKDNLEIGENSSIGMGSVVTKTVDACCSYFGNPAKPLRGLKTGPKR
tara:strand:+ start:1521 stop:2429 length:909 start_codon:yes stop_codon:yes gene_type:complete